MCSLSGCQSRPWILERWAARYSTAVLGFCNRIGTECCPFRQRVCMELTVSCVLSRDRIILRDTVFILRKLHFLFRANKTVTGKDFSSSPSRRLHIWAYETNFFPSGLRHGNKRRWVLLPIVVWSAIPAPLPHNHPRRGAVTSQQSNPEGKLPI